MVLDLRQSPDHFGACEKGIMCLGFSPPIQIEGPETGSSACISQEPSESIAIQLIHGGVVLQSHGTVSVHGSTRSCSLGSSRNHLPSTAQCSADCSIHPANGYATFPVGCCAPTIAFRPSRVLHSPTVIFTLHLRRSTPHCVASRSAFRAPSPIGFGPRTPSPSAPMRTPGTLRPTQSFQSSRVP